MCQHCRRYGTTLVSHPWPSAEPLRIEPLLLPHGGGFAEAVNNLQGKKLLAYNAALDRIVRLIKGIDS